MLVQCKKVEEGVEKIDKKTQKKSKHYIADPYIFVSYFPDNTYRKWKKGGETHKTTPNFKFYNTYIQIYSGT